MAQEAPGGALRPERQAWRLVKTVLLAETQAEPGDPLIWSHTDHLKLAVAKEMTLRAVLPLAEAKPCYLAGYSVVIRA